MRADSFIVSVIIPAYNEAGRIAAAIETVLAQTLAPEEIIVVDDGSTDETAALAAAYPVRVVRQRNAGISAARNRGFREATGTWLALLDADDLWLPERLASLASAVAGRPEFGFVFSDYTVEEDGRPNAPSNLARTPQYLAARGAPSRAVAPLDRGALCAALAVGNFLGTSTVSIRRELVLREALFFDETLPLRGPDYQLSEDVEWYLRVLKWTDALAIEHVLARYVRRPDSQAEAYGRVRYGDVKLGERIAAAPQSYGPGTGAAFAKMRRQHLRHAAQLHFRAADFGAARSILAQAQSERYALREALWLVAAAALDYPAGYRLMRALRSLWHQRLRPGLRALGRARSRA